MLIFNLFFILTWDASCSAFLFIRHPSSAGFSSISESLETSLPFHAGSSNPTWWCFDDFSKGGWMTACTAVEYQVNFFTHFWREKPTSAEYLWWDSLLEPITDEFIKKTFDKKQLNCQAVNHLERFQPVLQERQKRKTSVFCQMAKKSKG